MPIKQANSLKAGESKELLVHAEYRKDVTEEQMAEASNKTISFKVTINYKQADGTEEEPAYEEPVYYQKMNSVEIQETSPEEPIYIAQYDDGNYGICFYNNNENSHQCFKENNFVAEFKHAKATLFNEWNNCIYSDDYINAKSCKSGMISIILYNDGNIYGQLGSIGAIKCTVDHNANVYKCTFSV